MDILEAFFLANVASFEIEYALIIVNTDSTLLIVLGDEKLLKQAQFKSVKGAKISFAKTFYKRINGNEVVKPDWVKTSLKIKD